ncbi:MAG: cytochrome C [Rhodanobacteraceae bacterium]
MPNPRVRVYLDNNPEPVIDHELPTRLDLDTRTLQDGPHRLIVRAAGQSGVEGIEEIPFHVQNGPGILVSGLRPGSTRNGIVRMNVDAFSADDPFDPRRAEARSAIPTWVWVLFMVIIAWVVFYVASMWFPPPKFANTPTYGSNPAAVTYGSKAKNENKGHPATSARGDPDRPAQKF